MEAITNELMTPKQYLLSVPVPEQTNTYKPVTYEELIRVTLESIDSCGFILDQEIYTHSNDGMRANGKYLLQFGNDPDMSLMIAWQNSYDKSLSLKLAVGTYVFICTNGCVSGDMGTYKSKHVGDVQEISPAKVKEFICNAGESFFKMVEEKEEMKSISITNREMAELLGRMFIDKEIITSTQLNVIKNEIKKPTYDYGDVHSVWTLYNYATFAIRDTNPRYWLQTQIDIHKFFTQEFNID